MDDADMELAAMFSGFTICSHAGQGCAITTRLLVPGQARPGGGADRQHDGGRPGRRPATRR